MKVIGIYLAAGNSSRMGSHKLSLPIGTMSLGSLALETALKSPLHEVYVIIKESDNAEWVPVDMKSDSRCTIIHCPTSDEGQSESLRCGIQLAQANHADAVIILLADQPFITVQIIVEMIDCMKKNPTCRFVATTFEQTIMPPVLFSSALYPELMNLRGDQGARSILREDLFPNGKFFPCSDKRLIFDIDTDEDYRQIIEASKEK